MKKEGEIQRKKNNKNDINKEERMESSLDKEIFIKERKNTEIKRKKEK